MIKLFDPEIEIEIEKERSKFLEELLKILYGDGFENLTINEARKYKSSITNLISAAQAVIEAIDVQECDPIMALKSAVDEASRALTDARLEELLKARPPGNGAR